ncbi:MAG: glutamine amidotransferase, partial [Candidatus Poribacteria bacterium]|nr:glutamine amidotransferase [Candidatus Poribacteria bacterium]
GLQNMGEASALLDLVRASDIELFTIPLASERAHEVWVRDLRLPSRVRSGQAFDVRVVIEATADTQVTVRLYRNDIPITDAQSIDLEQGKHPIDFPQQISEEGSYEYRLELSVDDSIADLPENNTGYGVVRVSGSPRVLYVEGDAEYADLLKTVLEKNRLTVEVIASTEFPTDLVALQNSDTLILSNVSADDLSMPQMALIESYVRDLGKGLVVIGGERAFGRGGYHDTPLERILPVDMTPRQKKESLALMLVVDASGSMANYVGVDQKIRLAIEGVRASIRALDDEDRVGVIGFAAKIKKEILLTTEHESIIREVGKLRPGSGTRMYPALERAYERLKVVDAKQKHILLLSDGKSEGDFIPLVEQSAAEDKITISTIAIGDADRALMKRIAEAGGGQARDVRNVSQLPKVMADEVRQTQKYTVQEPFQPIINDGMQPILAGIDQVPKLYGYIATSEKEVAQVYIHSHEEHPILAAWHYGLGRSIAFTSDVKPGWAADWIAWDNFGKFWGQVVNWVLPQRDGNTDFKLDVSHHNGRGQVIVETTSIGHTEHTFDVRVARPNAEGETIELHRITPTRYAGEFPIRQRGVYLVTAQKQRNGQVESSARESLVLSYPTEFSEFETNRQLLNELASQTNGIFEPSPGQIAHHAGKGLEHLKPLSFPLLIVCVVLFVLEMILRRLSIGAGYVAELQAQLSALRRREAGAPSPTLTRLRQSKAVLAQRAPTTFTPQPAAPVGSVPAGHSAAGGVRSSIGGGTGRLLQAKRRAQGGR